MMRVVTEALRNQLNSCFYMTKVLLEVCPSEVWAESFNGVPFWQQVYHFVNFADFWLRCKPDEPDKIDFPSMAFGEDFSTDLYADSYEGLFISQVDMAEYLRRIIEKVACMFDKLDDNSIAQPVSTIDFPFIDEPQKYTHIDVITGQIRHFMYNLGYLNGILRKRGLPEADWYAYNEPEGS